MRSLLALLVAVGMVAGALYLRGRDGDAISALQGDEPPVVVCATELRPACDALEQAGARVRVEPAPATAEQLATTTAPQVDAWLVPAPWPQIVDALRTPSGAPPLFAEAPQPLASSPVVLAVWDDRARVLAEHCAQGGVDWSCLGEAAGRSWADLGGPAAWGPVKVSHDDPSSTSLGLVVLGAAASNRLGDVDFSTRDLRSDRFLDWFSQLEQSIQSFGSATTSLVGQMLTFGPGRYDAVGSVEALALPVLERSPRGDDVRLYSTEPAVTADVVLAPLQGRSSERLRELAEGSVRPALEDAGWRVEGQDGEPAVAEEGQRPPAGALQALQALWSEVQ